MRAALALLLGLAACGGSAPSPKEVTAARAKAEDAAARLMKTLMGELTAALAQGPPEAALGVCAEKAQDMTARISKETGATVRRTSTRLRNPANAPDAYEAAWLEKAAATHARGGAVEATAEVVGDELRFLRPIVLAPLCAQCHGSGLSDGVKSALAERYPQDAATGYAAGDFRGAVSVRVPLR